MDRIEQLEERINNHVFLSLFREKDTAAYQREKNRFLELVWEYVCLRRRDAEEYALELCETVDACLKSYAPEKGLFMHYFNTAFRAASAKSGAIEDLQARNGGRHVPNSLREDACAVLRFVKRRGISASELSANRGEFLEALGMSEERFDEIAKYVYYSETVVIDASDDPDSDGGRLDFVSSIAVGSGENDPIVSYLEREGLADLLSAAEEVYCEANERAKPIISMKLTEVLSKVDFDGNVGDYAFGDEALFALMEKRNEGIKDKDVARACGCSAPNVTQVWKRFKSALAARLEA